jgi:hypothetical protein
VYHLQAVCGCSACKIILLDKGSFDALLGQRVQDRYPLNPSTHDKYIKLTVAQFFYPSLHKLD